VGNAVKAGTRLADDESAGLAAWLALWKCEKPVSATKQPSSLVSETVWNDEEVARATASTIGAVKQKAHRAYECLHRAFGCGLSEPPVRTGGRRVGSNAIIHNFHWARRESTGTKELSENNPVPGKQL
jgi:hypothetical protein